MAECHHFENENRHLPFFKFPENVEWKCWNW